MPVSKKHNHNHRPHRRRWWGRGYRDPYYWGGVYGYPYPAYYNTPAVVYTQPTVVATAADEAPVVVPAATTTQQWLTYGGIAVGAVLIGALLMANAKKSA